MDEKPLVNRVAQSGIITINLEDFYPKEEIAVFDLKDYLFRGLILREKDFREAVAAHDWTQYQDKILVINCSTDAIIPVWAFQLATISATPFAKNIIYGTVNDAIIAHYYKILQSLDLNQFAGQRIVIKGCSEKPVPIAAYTEMARLLTPIAKKIMYGEPCSTVPLFSNKS